MQYEVLAHASRPARNSYLDNKPTRLQIQSSEPYGTAGATLILQSPRTYIRLTASTSPRLQQACEHKFMSCEIRLGSLKHRRVHGPWWYNRSACWECVLGSACIHCVYTHYGAHDANLYKCQILALTVKSCLDAAFERMLFEDCPQMLETRSKQMLNNVWTIASARGD